MKVSKSLLQAIAIAVTIGTTGTSCTKEKNLTTEHQQGSKVSQEGNCPTNGGGGVDSCVACGMG